MTARDPALGDNHARGVAYLLAAIGLLGLMEVGVKTLTESMSVGQILWARFFFHLVAAWPIFMMLGVRSVARTERPLLQCLRSLLQLLATLGVFLALAHAPLAEAISIHYLSPLIVTALSLPLLGERVSLARWLAVVAGFAGLLVILRPGFEGAPWGAGFALISAVSYALFQITTRMLGITDRPWTTMFYTPLVGAAAASMVVPFVWTPPTPTQWLILVAIGVFAGVAHYMLIKAFQHAQASEPAALQLRPHRVGVDPGNRVFRGRAGGVDPARRGADRGRRHVRVLPRRPCHAAALTATNASIPPGAGGIDRPMPFDIVAGARPGGRPRYLRETWRRIFDNRSGCGTRSRG